MVNQKVWIRLGLCRLSLLSFILIMIPLTALGGPAGNPTAQTPAQKLSLGALIDLYSQDFKSNSIRLTGKGDRFLFNFNYGVDRNVEFFGNAGFSKENLEYGGQNFSGNYGLGVQFGAKATLAELRKDHMKFGGGARLLLARSSVDFSSTQQSDVDWAEFGLFGGLSFEPQADLVPYVGLQLVQTTSKIKDLPIGGRNNFDQDTMVGLFGGLNLKIQKDLSFGMELRMINELSATLNLSFLL